MMKLGKFEINASVDEDGHLTLWVVSTDGSPVIDMGESVAASDSEFAVRLTTEEIERQYAATSQRRTA